MIAHVCERLCRGGCGCACVHVAGAISFLFQCVCCRCVHACVVGAISFLFLRVVGLFDSCSII